MILILLSAATALTPAPASWHPHAGWVIPFVVLLLAIALIPQVKPHWWEPNRNKALVSTVVALPVVVCALLADPHAVLHAATDYASFIVLLAALFVVCGGILITGDLAATPVVNTLFLLAGALLASCIGTTGASMLLIRPLLATNVERAFKVHTVVFFIFLVSNIGGCLTPLGDPPLFMGYLKGVPFAWTLGLWKEWAVAVVALLAVYLLLDIRLYGRETSAARSRDRTQQRPLVITGARNLFFLAGIVAAVAFLAAPLREAAMVVLAAVAWFTTKPEVRARNGFAPIVEVVVVFAGIFATMIPALLILEQRGAELGVVTPRQFFWATGSLSAFLDNTPTYLAFLALANGDVPWSAALRAEMLRFGTADEPYHVPQPVLVAISLGAVFMGAATYIGNGPNFMVRAIAAENGIRMPSFFGYLGWAALFLIPLFAAMSFVFLPA